MSYKYFESVPPLQVFSELRVEVQEESSCTKVCSDRNIKNYTVITYIFESLIDNPAVEVIKYDGFRCVEVRCIEISNST